MRKISVVMHEDVVLSAVTGAMDLVNGVNDLAGALGMAAPFSIELVGTRFKNISVSSSVQFLCNKTMTDVLNTDLVLIPPFVGDADTILEKHKSIVEWIQVQNSRKTEWASLCVGAYFLAEAGLLDNRKATAHWKAIDHLKVKYPSVDFQPDKIITDHEGVYTSGGAFSSLNLILYLIEKFCGKEIAIAISKDFAIEFGRPSQNYFSIFKGQRRHEDGAIHKAQDYIEKNFLQSLHIDQIATYCNMSKRNFIRRFIHSTGLTPLEYIQRLKIESAKKALESTTHPISSVMYDVGYNDSKTFREVFKKITGLTPQAYQAKYNHLS